MALASENAARRAAAGWGDGLPVPLPLTGVLSLASLAARSAGTARALRSALVLSPGAALP